MRRAPEALAARAAAALAAGDWPAARAALGRLAARPDAPPEIHYNLGLVCRRQGDDGAACRHLDAALARRPSHANARFERAALDMEAERIAAARRGFVTCLALAPGDPDALVNLAALALRAGDGATAARALARVTRPDDRAAAHLRLAWQRDHGDPAAFDRAWRTRYRAHPEERPALLKLATQGPRGTLPLRAGALLEP